MSNDLYYYVKIDNQYVVESTDSIDDLITMLYDKTADFITNEQRIELGLDQDYIDQLKKSISQNESRIPLYDIYSNHIFLICWDNVYERITYDNYRFIDHKFISDLTSLKNPTENDSDNARFLAYYDINELEKTYMKIFYKSFVINSYITRCRRPSFSSGMEHISAYYNMNELNFLAIDWNLTDRVTLDSDKLDWLCKQISQYDISAQTLIDHQFYIYNTKSIGLVKHYSLFGSYYMNKYLRKTRCCLDSTDSNSTTDIIRNLYLENQIKIMIRAIKGAPAFEKSHTVYRFVDSDSYLQHLKIGDIYTDPSFMSTTRNPYYYKEHYAFGYVLIKIKIPAEIVGVGLCIESYSNFPNEEEIILPPTSKYRLDNVTETSYNTEFHKNFRLVVNKKYEFTWIGDSYSEDKPIQINIPDAYVPKPRRLNFVDLLLDDDIRSTPIVDRLINFRNNYTNIINQFECAISGRTYVLNMDAYDSSTVYKPFFFYEVPDGIMITTSNPKYGNINILMEIGPDIHVNYYFKFSVTDVSNIVDIGKQEWIEWLSMLAYIVGSKNVTIHSNYILQYNENDTIDKKIMKTRYPFSQNIYEYMKKGKKMFVYTEVRPQFDYPQIDWLSGVQISEIIKSSDKNELYRISQTAKINNIFDFYIYIVENYPKLIKTLEEKIDILYEPENNPFRNTCYVLDAWQYLYNHKLISQIPLEREFTIKRSNYKKLTNDKNVPKFKNRLRVLTRTIDQDS